MTIHQHSLITPEDRQKTYVQVGHAYRIPLLIGDQIQGLIPSILPVS